MRRKHTLVVPEKIADQLRWHLYPGDGLEAAALLLCSSAGTARHKLLAREIVLVPHRACIRRRDMLTWPGETVEAAIDLAAVRGDCILAVHSHPGGLFAFSAADDVSDQTLMPALRSGTDRMPGSAIMIPDGSIRARLYPTDQTPEPVDLILQAGSDIRLWWNDLSTAAGPLPLPMAFTSEMRAILARLTICIIGVSGTGSVTAEQLARLGIGQIILIDFDRMEERNLNRILNASVADLGRFKVEMFAAAIRRYRPDCEVITVTSSVATREAVLAASEADILFSCVDTAEGRHIADRIAAYFAMPLFDMGVAIPTASIPNGRRRIAEVYGRIDYVFPGGSGLMDRGVYDARLLEAEYLARTAPQALAQRIADGYLQGVVEEAPGVIALNMRAASACVIEFLARLFPFREIRNDTRARTIFMLAEGDEDIWSEDQFEAGNRFSVAEGASEPLLGLPALAKTRRVA